MTRATTRKHGPESRPQNRLSGMRIAVVQPSRGTPRRAVAMNTGEAVRQNFVSRPKNRIPGPARAFISSIRRQYRRRGTEITDGIQIFHGNVA